MACCFHAVLKLSMTSLTLVYLLKKVLNQHLSRGKNYLTHSQHEAWTEDIDCLIEQSLSPR